MYYPLVFIVISGGYGIGFNAAPGFLAMAACGRELSWQSKTPFLFTKADRFACRACWTCLSHSKYMRALKFLLAPTDLFSFLRCTSYLANYFGWITDILVLTRISHSILNPNFQQHRNSLFLYPPTTNPHWLTW